MYKKYVVRLTVEERGQLEGIVSKGKAAVRKIVHAQILLKTDRDGPDWTDERIAEAFGVHANTVRCVRERFVNEGLESALHRKKAVRPPVPRKLDGDKEAHLLAIACGKPPEGRARWTPRRTRIDWAHAVKEVLDGPYAHVQLVRLVMDNLNTHSIASLYEAFPPQEARRLARKLEIHYTPKHGSWLNVAEIELKALSIQCLDRRIPDIEMLDREVTAWERDRNAATVTVDGQFRTPDARIKLKRLYPQIQA